MKRKIFASLMGLLILSTTSLSAFASTIDYKAESEARKSSPVQTNAIENWPQGPAIGAESAILMDADSGAVLYAKNIDCKQYPASTTKILTCLLAEENCEPDEIVTFSHQAIYSIEPGSSNIGMDEGQSITMDQALHGILILSANEVANAVGEHIAGTSDAFVEMMNKRAEELGCKNSHFMNANGLHDENHYTTAYDLALIAREFFSYDALCDISGSTYCTFEATATQPDSFHLATKNQLVKGKAHEYEYLVGSKTGYTSISRQTLVSCAKKDGMKLICVILKEESPMQFTDTIELFNYGFSNFTRVNISENDTKYNITGSDFFDTGADVYGNSAPILSLNSEDCLILPNNLTIDDLTTQLTYNEDTDSVIATINYSYKDHFIGSTSVIPAVNQDTIKFNELPSEGETATEIVSEIVPEVVPVSENVPDADNSEKDTLFVNVKLILLCVSGIAGCFIIFLIVKSSLKNYRSAKKRRSIMRRRRRNSSETEFKNYKF